MENSAKYDQVYIEAFGVSPDQLPDLKYQGIAAWDSVGHMALVASLESAFGIELDIDDIIDFSSYERGKLILAKYNTTV